MPDAIEVPNLEGPEAERNAEGLEAAGFPKKLAVMSAPQHRDRPVTNLGKVFGQFAYLQQQIGEQVMALEESVHNQKEDVAAAMEQLPQLRERVNWLIASFYEQSKKDEAVRERLGRHDIALVKLADAVRAMHKAQTQWQTALEEILGGLTKARSVVVPPLPEL